MIKQVETHKRLGFDSIEKLEVVKSLNDLLANYQVHYQKLRNFHWNVKGPDFFDLHHQFELEYNEVKAQIDEIAERIRTFGATPYSNLSDYLAHCNIKESGTKLSSTEMVEHVIQDYSILLSFLIEAIERANEVGDIGTSDILTKYMKRMEKRHWMFSSFLNRS